MKNPVTNPRAWSWLLVVMLAIVALLQLNKQMALKKQLAESLENNERFQNAERNMRAAGTGAGDSRTSERTNTNGEAARLKRLEAARDASIGGNGAAKGSVIFHPTVLRLATPARAAQTVLRAVSAGDKETLAVIHGMDADAEARLAEFHASLPEQTRQKFSDAKEMLFHMMTDDPVVHYRMKDSAQINGDEAGIRILVTRQSGEQSEEVFHLKREQDAASGDILWMPVLTREDVEAVIKRFEKAGGG